MLGPAGIPIGRAAESERLDELAARARRGESGALVLLGPAGSGKSTLLDALRDRAGDLRLLRATGVEAESDLPFAGLDALLRPVLGRLEQLPPIQAAALEAALALGPGDAGNRFAVGVATVSLLACAAAERPVLCLVDDLQWIDEPSREALLFAARRLVHEGVAMVLASRDDRDHTAALRGVPSLRLAPLDRTAARAVLDALSDGDMPDETAGPLIDAAAGNPLLLHELVAGTDPDVVHGRARLIGPPRAGATAEDLLARRIDALPADARAALLLAAATGDDAVPRLEAALTRLGMDVEALAPAEASDLVELRSGRLVFRHPLVRSVAYHRAEPAARRRSHAAIAAVLDPADPARAWQLAAAADRPDEDVARGLMEAADAARRSGGFASAARAARRAADLTPDAETRGQRLYAAADDFERAGIVDEAVRAIDESAALRLSAATRARFDGLRAHLLFRHGHPAEARPQLLHQARTLRTANPVGAARFLLQAAYASMFLGDVDGCERHSREAIELLPDPDEPTRCTALAMRAAALMAGGRGDEAGPLTAEVHARVLRRDPRTGPMGGAVEVYGLMALAEIAEGRRAEADRLVDRLLADARALGAVTGMPYVLAARATVDVRLGRLAAGLASAGEAVRLAEATEQPILVAGALAIRSLAAADLGMEADAVRDARRALAFDAAPGVGLKATPLHALGVLALARGRLDEAVEHLRASAAARAADGWRQPNGMYATFELVEALIRRGDREEATRILEDVEDAARRAQADLALAMTARSHGLLAPDDDIDAAFEHALALCEGLPVPVQRGRTLLCLGERLRRARRSVDARVPLREAHALFDRLGYADWARCARRELRAAGGMAPPARRRDVAALTDHEVQVALMAARGLTNREIAGALFLAPKTIEHHLSTIFRKVGVRRRAELAARFADELNPAEAMPVLA